MRCLRRTYCREYLSYCLLGGVATNYSFNYVNGTLTVTAVSSPIEVHIGGTLQGSYFLTSGQSARDSYAGVTNVP